MSLLVEFAGRMGRRESDSAPDFFIGRFRSTQYDPSIAAGGSLQLQMLGHVYHKPTDQSKSACPPNSGTIADVAGLHVWTAPLLQGIFVSFGIKSGAVMYSAF